MIELFHVSGSERPWFESISSAVTDYIENCEDSESIEYLHIDELTGNVAETIAYDRYEISCFLLSSYGGCLGTP